jgi:hypothetical protein
MDPGRLDGTVRAMRAATWALVLMTCVRAVPPAPPPAPPPPPPEPPPLDVPEGCLGSLAGTWRAADAPGVRYEADDDGGTARFLALAEPAPASSLAPRRFSRLDGGLPWLVRDGGGPTPAIPRSETRPMATLVLTRSATGFSGFVGAPSGSADCVPGFAARVRACGDEQLTVETILSARFDAECRPLDGGGWATRTLRRDPVDAGAVSPDASWPDGG